VGPMKGRVGAGIVLFTFDKIIRQGRHVIFVELLTLGESLEAALSHDTFFQSVC
jgi:hypothetical protein